jgi:hypothetical protein
MKNRTFPVESKAWITPSPMAAAKEPRRRPTTSSRVVARVAPNSIE